MDHNPPTNSNEQTPPAGRIDADRPTADELLLWEQCRASIPPDEPAGEAPSLDDLPPLLLASYLDGRCTDDERLMVERVLANDPAALDDLLALRRTVADLSAANIDATTAVSDEATRRAHALVADTSATKAGPTEQTLTDGVIARIGGRWRSVLVGSGWAAAAIFTIFVGIGGYQAGSNTYQSTNDSSVLANEASLGADEPFDSDLGPEDELMLALLDANGGDQ